MKTHLRLGALVIGLLITLGVLVAPTTAFAATGCSNDHIVQTNEYLSELTPNWEQIAVANGISDPNMIFVGQHICLDSAGAATDLFVSTPAHTGWHPNIGMPGSCVWYVFSQRPDLYIPPTPYAKDFGWLAAQQGYRTGTWPQVEAIAVFQPGDNGANSVAGHVAMVRAVYANGTFLVEEMNALAGMWHTDERVVSLDWGVSFIY